MNQIIRPLPLYYRGMPSPEPGKRFSRQRQLGDTSELSLQMLQGDRTYSFDANMGLSDGVAAITVSGYAQYGGADGIVDFGGNQNGTITLPSIADSTTLTPQQARIDAMLVIDVTAVTVSGSALEKIIMVGSNDAAFGVGKVAQLGMIEFGAASAQEQTNALVTAAPNAVGGSRYEIGFTTEQNNIKYQFGKIFVVISGSGSITFKAFVAVLPEP